MKREETRQIDVAIIGAGPIGIEIAAGFKHAGVDYVQFEAGAIGSTILWWAPFTKFFSSPERIEICGVPLQSINQEKATREEYLAYLRAVVAQFQLPIELFTRVARLGRDRGEFVIETRPSAQGVGGPEETARNPHAPGNVGSSTRTWRAKRVVLAIGNMHRPRMLNVAGEDLPHVNHYLQEVHRYFNRRVLIVGGRNSAVEAAIRLHRAGAIVAMSYRKASFDATRVKYWLRPELEWLIAKGRIEFHPETCVEKIEPSAVTLRSAARNGAPRLIEADEVLLLTGYDMDCGLLRELGAELRGEEQVPAFDPQTMETSVPGVYVAGTAASGSAKRATLFIENCHVHAARIVRAIAGASLPWNLADQPNEFVES
jgi:thioredoxin reductase (NADPH)